MTDTVGTIINRPLLFLTAKRLHIDVVNASFFIRRKACFILALQVLHLRFANSLNKLNYHHRNAEDNEDYADGTVERFRACFICEL